MNLLTKLKTLMKTPQTTSLGDPTPHQETKSSNPTMHTTVFVDPITEQRVGVKVAANVPNMYQDVIDFHKKFRIQYDGPPRQLPEQLDTFRRMRFHEEIKEIRDAQDAN